MVDQTNNSSSEIKPPWMSVPSSSSKKPAPAKPAAPAPSLAPPTPLANSPLPPKPQAPPAGKPKSSIVSSPFKKLIPFLGVAILVAIIAFAARAILTKKDSEVQDKSSKKEITLTYWGLWEPKTIMEPILTEYKKEHPEVTINYEFQSSKDYRERLQSQLAAGSGPDIFRIHDTWIPMFLNQKQLAAVPEGLIDWNDYYPVIKNTLNVNGEYYAVPLMIDTLALFYNKELFTSAGQSPPKNWKELIETAKKLTVFSGNTIQTAGIALGVTNNIDNWSDIYGLMMLQAKGDLANPIGTKSEEVLKFYTRFYNVEKVWDTTLSPSTYAFATGKAAMIIAPSWRVFEIQKTNPALEFETIPVPQLSEDPNQKYSWASFWVEGVSETSPNKKAAWEFLQFLSKPETLEKLYTYQSQVRLFGEPYPRKSMAGKLINEPIVGSFISQAPYAQTWYLCSRTFDNGINDRTIKYYENMVNSALTGRINEDVLEQAAAGVQQTLSQYQIGVQTP